MASSAYISYPYSLKTNLQLLNQIRGEIHRVQPIGFS